MVLRRIQGLPVMMMAAKIVGRKRACGKGRGSGQRNPRWYIVRCLATVPRVVSLPRDICHGMPRLGKVKAA